MEKENLVVGDRVEWVTGNGVTLIATVINTPDEWGDVEVTFDPSKTGAIYRTAVSASRLHLHRGTTSVYNIICTLDGELAEFNVWADTKAEANGLLRDRFTADETVVAIEKSIRLTTASATAYGTVLWIR